MTSTDPLDLDAIEARAAATPGPWRDADTHLGRHGHTATVLSGTGNDTDLRAWLPSLSQEAWDETRNVWADAAFIAAARADVDALVAEVRRLRDRVTELENAPLCGKTWGANGNEYSPCARREGHEEAYCRSADGNDYFLAAADDCPGCATPAR